MQRNTTIPSDTALRARNALQRRFNLRSDPFRNDSNPYSARQELYGHLPQSTRLASVLAVMEAEGWVVVEGRYARFGEKNQPPQHPYYLLTKGPVTIKVIPADSGTDASVTVIGPKKANPLPAYHD